MTDHTNLITPRDWQIQAQAEAAESYAARMAEARRYGAMADALEAAQAEIERQTHIIQGLWMERDVMRAERDAAPT